MGAAVSLMDYICMASARFMPSVVPQPVSRLAATDVFVSAAVLCYPSGARVLMLLSERKMLAKVSLPRRPNIEQPLTSDPSPPPSDIAAREVCHGNRR